ncbi:DUF4190 domain-containing protein [Arthrobacter methylotrophus]|uniref:DUF4190 domain-containing protein n=1 Tax=Arthrobacter methylotrophus TaxID=121291 RepID=A0ABV5UQF1_9MICC
MNTTTLASICLAGVGLSAVVATLTGNPMFALVGGGTSVIALLLIAALVPSGQPTKPIDGSKTNTLAVIALVAACMTGLAAAAIIFGHVARDQISREGGRGDKLALAALIVGYSEVALSAFTAMWLVTFLRFH